jgi:uncharacterized protein YjbJ (UPF0337 family)/ElaB/YqjD/DUF883 family membrane-anchored ribosome-binding protein
MVNEQTLQGNWNEIKGKLRNKWGQLTNDELQQAHGNVDQLIGLIQRKTGEARNSIERFLEDATAGGSAGFAQTAETAREYAQQAMETVQQRSQQAAETFRRGYGQATDSMRHGYEEAETMIRERPAESAAVCFGVGMVVGVVLGLALRGR